MKLEDIKHGQYLYYTEREYGSDYADSLVHVRDVDGVLMAHPVCTNWQGEYINETPDNWGTDLPVASHYDPSCWHPTHYTGGDPAEWMAANANLVESSSDCVERSVESSPRIVSSVASDLAFVRRDVSSVEKIVNTVQITPSKEPPAAAQETYHRNALNVESENEENMMLWVLAIVSVFSVVGSSFAVGYSIGIGFPKIPPNAEVSHGDRQRQPDTQSTPNQP
jgi:hypothetical protein